MNNEKTFDPHNQTICDLFSCSAIYVIPNYQRQYSWGNEQLDELWNDLYESYKNNDKEPYFLGSIVVVDDGNGRHELVDGQQRVTTLMIMMNVLYKDFPELNKENSKNLILYADNNLLRNLIFLNGSRNRLQLQTDPNYNADFNEVIINPESFNNLEYPTQVNLKKDIPKYKYINSAKFFYDKFNELLSNDGEEELDSFVNYIFYKTDIIKIVCTNQSFAIKLFQVLNDRGMELASSDIVKSYILDKYDRNDPNYEYDKQVFSSNWKKIEDICSDNDLKMDDFMVFYEYFKLRSNPKKQVTDELKAIIQKMEGHELVDEMIKYANNINKIYSQTNPVALSLRYIPWQAYVITAMATAYQVNYSNIEELFKIMRRFFYIAWISGKTLNGIKQVSFNLIDYIASNKSINEISNLLDNFVSSKHLIRDAYQSLDDDVYGESFLKPLLLSVEYDIREDINTSFYEINNKIHLDHILPQKFDRKKNEWSNISDINEAKQYLNKLGNMALLQGKKNEEALNFGFDTKMRIYNGDGSTKGKTGFITTMKIIDTYNDKSNQNNQVWDINHIKERQSYLMNLIESMLEISREDIETENTLNENKSSYYKWIYNGEYLTNKAMVQNVILDYIKDNNFKSYDEIPAELSHFKMFSHDLIQNDNYNPEQDNYTYDNFKVNNFTIYIRGICLENDTNNFVNLMRKLSNYNITKISGEEQ